MREPANTLSRRVREQDFHRFKLILAVDNATVTESQRLCPPLHLGKLRLFLDFAEDLKATEIPDPYYRKRNGFDRVLDLCEAAASGLIKNLVTRQPR